MQINITLDVSNRNMNVKFLVVVAAVAVMLVASSAIMADNALATKYGQTICHRPPGNPENGKTLELPLPAAIAHLTHHPDDTFGPCGEEEVCDQPIVNRLFDTLYDITLDQTLGGPVVAGDELCLSGHVDALGRISPLGIQTAFDITHPEADIDGFGILVAQVPANGCSNLGQPPGTFVHATVTSGNPTVDGVPLTEVCVRGA